MMKNPTPRTCSPGGSRRILGRSSSRHERSRRRRDERGSSLILALVYIVSVSLIVGALADWAMNDLSNTAHFQNASTLDNAVSGATEVAIQSIRYYPQWPATSGNTPANCWTPSGTLSSDVTINNDLVGVWCSTKENLQSPNTRTVTFIACPVTAAEVSGGTAEGLCQGGTLHPSLKAVVVFDDYPSGGGGLLATTCSGGPGVCGFAATTTQWSWS
jgi:hypothetical protein